MTESFDHLTRPRDEVPPVRPGTPELRKAVLEAMPKSFDDIMHYPQEEA